MAGRIEQASVLEEVGTWREMHYPDASVWFLVWLPYFAPGGGNEV